MLSCQSRVFTNRVLVVASKPYSKQKLLCSRKKRVDRLHGKLKSVITPEEKKRFEELNALHGSQDPADRERFLKLANEYQRKVHEALKK